VFVSDFNQLNMLIGC